MKNLVLASEIFVIDDFEGYELVNVCVAVSSLKINDREFIENLVKALQKNLKKLDKDDLLNLARSFIIYIRLFEDFYLEVHN